MPIHASHNYIFWNVSHETIDLHYVIYMYTCKVFIFYRHGWNEFDHSSIFLNKRNTKCTHTHYTRTAPHNPYDSMPTISKLIALDINFHWNSPFCSLNCRPFMLTSSIHFSRSLFLFLVPFKFLACQYLSILTMKQMPTNNSIELTNDTCTHTLVQWALHIAFDWYKEQLENSSWTIELLECVV